jgi:hypothetical protein
MSFELEKSYYPITIKVSTNKSSSDIILTKSLFYTPPPLEKEGSKLQAKPQARPVKRGGAQKYEEYDDDGKTNELRESGGMRKEIGENPSASSSSPLYTDEKKYTFSSSLSSKKKIDSYFDSEQFEKVLGDVDYDVSKEAKYENSKFNVMQMLELFFPTSLPNHLNINTEHATEVLKTAASTATGTWLPTWLVSYFQGVDTSKYSYVSIGRKPYTVVGVLWKNNVASHPIYRRFFKDIVALEKAQTREIAKLTKEIQDITTEFNNAHAAILSARTELISNTTKTRALSTLTSMYNRQTGRSNAVNQNKYILPIQSAIQDIYNLRASPSSNQLIMLLYKMYLLEKDSSNRYESILPNEIRGDSELMKLVKMAIKIGTKKMILDYINNNNDERTQYIKEMKETETKDETRLKYFLEDFRKLSYGKIVSQMQRNISSVRSSNPALQDIIDEFVEGKYGTTLFELAKKISHNKIGEIGNLQILDTGVLNMAGEPEEKDKPPPKPKYEISISLELLDYVVNDKNIGKVDCNYRNNLLMKRYLQNTRKKLTGGKNSIMPRKYRKTKRTIL